MSMNVNVERLETVLTNAEVIYLSTSLNDVVSARPISPMNLGLKLYVRTSAGNRKATEMTANPHVAVCVENYYFTGMAKSLGSVFDESNAGIKAAYISRYPDSFSQEDEFIKSDEQFFEITIEHVSEWIYENGIPVGFAEQQL